MGGIASLKKHLWDLKLREQLLQTPKELSRAFELDEIDYETARVMATSNARSPDGVRRLMREYGVRDVHELIPLLPDRHFSRRVLQRAHALLRYAMGWYAYDPAVRDFKSGLNRTGKAVGADHLINPPGTRRKRRLIVREEYYGDE